MNSASPKSPGNNGQTDVGRGMSAALPVPSTPRGREQAVVGKATDIANGAGADDLIRKVPGRGSALNGQAR